MHLQCSTIMTAISPAHYSRRQQFCGGDAVSKLPAGNRGGTGRHLHLLKGGRSARNIGRFRDTAATNRTCAIPADSNASSSSSASASSSSSAGSGGRRRRSQNAKGALWVDTDCISCDTCRWMSPDLFGYSDGRSAVHSQPQPGSPEERAALHALSACPVGSIHYDERATEKRKAAMSDFPLQHPAASALGLEVFHLGHHSPDSYGATPWLVRNPATGVAAMVDSPRYSTGLRKALEERFGQGKVQYMFLTHADDVADHAKWAREMGLKRVIHETEADPALAITERSGRGLDECEIKLRGGNGDEGMPALRSWDPFEGALGEETRVIFQPGHTKGQCALHFQPDASGPAAAFTGDHLGWLRQTESLDAFTAFCKDSHRVQLDALKRWAGDDSASSIRIVFPGHGRVHESRDFVADLNGVCHRMQSRMEDGSLAATHTEN